MAPIPRVSGSRQQLPGHFLTVTSATAWWGARHSHPGLLSFLFPDDTLGSLWQWLVSALLLLSHHSWGSKWSIQGPLWCYMLRFIKIDGIPRRFLIQMATFSLIWIALLQKDYSWIIMRLEEVLAWLFTTLGTAFFAESGPKPVKIEQQSNL